MRKLLVFTDLDGSLLDHHDYSWEKAKLALSALDERSCPVIFNSSKTAAELIKLKRKINNYHPFVSENGSVVSIPADYFSPHALADKKHVNEFETHLFATPYKIIIGMLDDLRQKHCFKFKGFGDMSIDELASVCNLSHEQVQDAKQREASEPLLWLDTQEAFKKFKNLLEAEGYIVVSGGRFHHVMADVNKGKAVIWLKQQYINHEPQTEWITVGLGDGFNDVQMLEAVDYPVLIPNPETSQPDLAHLSHLISPPSPGPEGWNSAMLSIMDKIL